MSYLLRVVQVWTNLVLRFPRAVLAIAFVTALASVAFTASKLEMITDQLELISEDHPFIALSDRIDKFNVNNKRSLHVVIEAATPHRAIAFVCELASRIGQDRDHFQSMFYRVDPEPFKAWQLLYLDRPDLVALQERIEAHSSLIQKLAEDPDLLNFLKILNQQMSA